MNENGKQQMVSLYIPAYCNDVEKNKIIKAVSKQTHKHVQLLIFQDGNENFVEKLDQTEVPTPSVIYLVANHNKDVVSDLYKAIHEASGQFFLIADNETLLIDSHYLEQAVRMLQETPASVLCSMKDKASTFSFTQSSEKTDRILGLLSLKYWCELYSVIRLSDLQDVLSSVAIKDLFILLPLLVARGSFLYYTPINPDLSEVSGPFALKINTNDSTKQGYFSMLLNETFQIFQDVVSNKTPRRYYELKTVFIDTVVRSQDWVTVLLSEYRHKYQEDFSFAYISFFIEGIISFEGEGPFPIQISPNLISLDSIVKELQHSNQIAQHIVESTPRNAIVAAHFRPSPPRDGAENRCFQTLRAIKDFGYNVIFFSFVSPQWSFSAIKHIESSLNIKVILFTGDVRDNPYIQRLHTKGSPPWLFATPHTRKFFYDIYMNIKPCLVWINYANWANLVRGNAFRESINIIDTIDLLSLNSKMAKQVWHYLYPLETPYKADKIDSFLLREDFYDLLQLAPDLAEFKVYEQFDYCIAISKKESDILSGAIKKAKVKYLPFTFESKSVENTYSNNPVFAIGPNQFNFQGFFYFVNKVLPLVLEEEPSFKLNITGTGCNYLAPSNGINLLGFVPEIEEIYTHSKFAICPLIGATGQQLKVLEAMSYGLPVIALKNVAERCPIYHGVNGFVANNADEFAAYTLQLYQDPDLCRKLGEAARQTIKQEYNELVLTDKLRFLRDDIVCKKFNGSNPLKKKLDFIKIDLKGKKDYQYAKMQKNNAIKIFSKIYRRIEYILKNKKVR